MAEAHVKVNSTTHHTPAPRSSSLDSDLAPPNKPPPPCVQKEGGSSRGRGGIPKGRGGEHSTHEAPSGAALPADQSLSSPPEPEGKPFRTTDAAMWRFDVFVFTSQKQVLAQAFRSETCFSKPQCAGLVPFLSPVLNLYCPNRAVLVPLLGLVLDSYCANGTVLVPGFSAIFMQRRHCYIEFVGDLIST